MDLNIKISKKNTGKFFQKSPTGIDCTKAKQQAIADMGFLENKTRETRCYIGRESEVLQSLEFDFEYINIDEFENKFF